MKAKNSTEKNILNKGFKHYRNLVTKSEADLERSAEGARTSPLPRPPYFLQSFNFFAITLKNYKLSYSKLN